MKLKQYFTVKQNTLFLIISIFCAFALILNPNEIKNSVISAIISCLNTIIPSLFAMLVVTYFFIGIGFSNKTKRRIHFFTEKLFGLSGNCIEVIIAGLLGGYITASKSAVKLINNKIITNDEAKRLVLFFTCPGLSFCVNISGAVIYSDKTIGFQFLFSNIISCLIFAVLYNFYNKKNLKFNTHENTVSVIETFISSVSRASESLISICTWIVFFNVLSTCINTILNGRFEFIKLFSEATSAVKFSAENYPLYVSAFCLCFGGFCIFLQQLPDINTLGIKPTHYLISRLFQSAFCAVIQKLLMIFFPVNLSVSTNITRFQAFSHSAFGSTALLFLCIILLNSVKNAYSVYVKNN